MRRCFQSVGLGLELQSLDLVIDNKKNLYNEYAADKISRFRIIRRTLQVFLNVRLNAMSHDDLYLVSCTLAVLSGLVTWSRSWS